MRKADVTQLTLAKGTDELTKREIASLISETSLFSVEVTKKEGEIPLILVKATEGLMNRETWLRPETSLLIVWAVLMLRVKEIQLQLGRVTTRPESVFLKPKRKKWTCTKTSPSSTEATNKAEEKPLTPVRVTEEPTRRETV